MRGTRRAAAAQRWLLTAALAGALGFGGAQALAAPAPVPDGAPTCRPEQCDRQCRALGYQSGRCWNGRCTCLL
jgi:hypothetical protein